MKICTKCNIKKEFSLFNKSTKEKDGLQYHCRQCQLIYKEVSKEHRRIYDKNYKKLNGNSRNKEKRNLYEKYKKEIDINYKLSCNLRSRLKAALKNNFKSGSAIKDLGCSIEELKIHLENQFEPGMTWENWTIKGWHIDHIKPLKDFNLSTREEFLKACHYTNLRPLWYNENCSMEKNI